MVNHRRGESTSLRVFLRQRACLRDFCARASQSLDRARDTPPALALRAPHTALQQLSTVLPLVIAHALLLRSGAHSPQSLHRARVQLQASVPVGLRRREDALRETQCVGLTDLATLFEFDLLHIH